MDIDLSPLSTLAAERDISFDVLLKTLESALASAYQHTPDAFKHSRVEIERKSGRVTIWAREELEPQEPAETTTAASAASAEQTPAASQPATQSATQAPPAANAATAPTTPGAITHSGSPTNQAGEPTIPPRRPAPLLGPEFEVHPRGFGRIAAMTARNVMFQGLRDAADERVFGALAGKQGELISGVVQKGPDPTHVLVDVGGTEASLPPHEQVPGEKYPHGTRVKAIVTEVNRGKSGANVTLSRSHPKLVKELFALEVPEIADGSVEIRAIAREAGQRSKVAVASRVPGLNAKGACIGPMGKRVRAVMEELAGEKIDLIDYDADPRKFVAAALSPARVISATILDEKRKEIRVVVPDFQLSLAIGKEGQNARLAAKLTGWKIDIKSDADVTPSASAASETETTAHRANAA